MDPVEVTARFDLKGNIHPQRFTREGKTYPVVSTGRQWQDDAGTHILVMTYGDRIHELVFVPGEATWYLKPVEPGLSVA